jgi:ubiquinone biosynthesis protein
MRDLVVSATRVEFRDLMTPAALISALPWVVAFAWVARRLLGIRSGSPWSTFAAGFIGWFGAGAVLLLLDRRTSNTGTLLAVTLSTAILFTMLAVVALELGSRRRRASLPRGVPHPVRAMRQRAARLARYAQILRIAARHGLRMRRGDDPMRLPARQVRLALDEAGCMFVKLGQMLATRPEVVGPSTAAELTHLQEDVSPAPFEAVAALLQEELGMPAEEVFASFDREPIAAASVAQVHRARLRDDTRVVVKIQRPGVRDLVERDLSIMLRLANRAEERTTWGARAGVGAIAREFAENMSRELDFAQEARNISEIAAALESTPEVRVPEVYPELSTSRVLVMEELRGTSLAQADRLAALDVDREKLADILLRACLGSVMNGERFHADPHPGNVMVLEDARLALLDLGSTGRLDALEQTSIASMLMALRANDPELLREAVLGIATTSQPIEDRQLEHALARFMARHLGPGAVPSLSMLQDLSRTFLELGIALPSSTTLLFRMLVTLEGTLTTLCPGYPVIQAAQDFAPGLIQEHLGDVPLAERLRDEATAMLPMLRRAPRHLDRAATMLERGEIRLRLSPLATERDVRIVARLVNRLVLAFVGAAVGVVSVLLLGLSGGPVLSGAVTLFDVFGYIGLVLSIVLLLRVVAVVLHEDAAEGGGP